MSYKREFRDGQTDTDTDGNGWTDKERDRHDELTDRQTDAQRQVEMDEQTSAERRQKLTELNDLIGGVR